MARPSGSVLARVTATLAIATALGAGCTGKDPYNPGAPLGTFHVTAHLESTTCGAVPDPWEFDVRLSHEASTLYWVQGGAPVSGPVDHAMRASLASRTEATVRAADARTRTPACVLGREDALEVLLGDASGAAVKSPADTVALRGTMSYRFAPVGSSDCADQLVASGGDYQALPCEVRYRVVATRTVAPDVSRVPADGGGAPR